ncbi:hypothetical protein CC85DRAFT_288391 [Cutaneotrichosporon oleaginosum]|uniref:Uncharacterized protein n=1 Tax=Cutaneotrichosporon oleaginosum TaxID=879819 RepID=A0A0J0XEV2_9TREE|nr:uncharacterized protein CC85DRAFT_288391 [Cutaneotrichosporon oleaginosum]KLT39595.1 hypothetical protein CC85DRAFT_288391 [Cutaneotrichosporon oleaginosum]TXT15477.1 hypothetical protein COLE_01670 [Cutaneotrichosporon oleaginosum]
MEQIIDSLDTPSSWFAMLFGLVWAAVRAALTLCIEQGACIHSSRKPGLLFWHQSLRRVSQTRMYSSVRYLLLRSIESHHAHI